jgi:triosephosphate isomerase
MGDSIRRRAPGLDGALVGAASLEADSFLKLSHYDER